MIGIFFSSEQILDRFIEVDFETNHPDEYSVAPFFFASALTPTSYNETGCFLLPAICLLLGYLRKHLSEIFCEKDLHAKCDSEKRAKSRETI